MEGKIKTITISTIDDFYKLIRKHWNSRYLYRGQNKTSYELRPSIGRDIVNNNINKDVELIYFQEFKRLAYPFLEYKLENDWDWIALAQHYDLHTRLLDWTGNPLVAAYFAVKDYQNEDAIIYVFRYDDLHLADFSISPFSISTNQIFEPKNLSRRISAQSGIFTIHHDPEKVFNPLSLEKVIIKSVIKRELWVTLGVYNINEFSMFPGLNGLTHHLTTRYIRKQLIKKQNTDNQTSK